MLLDDPFDTSDSLAAAKMPVAPKLCPESRSGSWAAPDSGSFFGLSMDFASGAMGVA
jgi:hypothetical protein